MHASILPCRIGVLFYLATIFAVSGQDSSQTQPIQQAASSTQTQQVSQNQATLQAFQQGRQALTQSLQALMAQNPTPQQLQAWQQQNSAALANQQQLAQNLGAQSYLQPQASPPTLIIPPNASATQLSFLTTQAAIANARTQIHNQLLNALPTEVSDAQISQMQQSEAQLLQQRQGANLQLQAQQAQTLATQSAQQPLPLPPPLVLPPGASQQTTAFMTARDQLMRDQINFANQYTTATSDARNAAMTQWMQQNAGRFQQLQALAQSLSQSTTTTQN